MTRNTDSNYIKPVFIVGMVVFFCLFSTSALKSVGAYHFAVFYSVSYFAAGFVFYYIYLFMQFSIKFGCVFAFITLVIFFVSEKMRLLTFFSLRVFFCSNTLAYPAKILMAILCRSIFIEIRKGLNCFAITTFLGYDWFRHNRFLNKRLCLEPVARYTLAVGSSYYNNEMGGIQ